MFEVPFRRESVKKLIKLEHEMEIYTEKMKEWETRINAKITSFKELKTTVDNFLN